MDIIMYRLNQVDVQKILPVINIDIQVYYLFLYESRRHPWVTLTTITCYFITNLLNAIVQLSCRYSSLFVYDIKIKLMFVSSFFFHSQLLNRKRERLKRGINTTSPAMAPPLHSRLLPAVMNPVRDPSFCLPNSSTQYFKMSKLTQ